MDGRKIITSSADGYAYADISLLGEILRVGASKISNA